MLKKLTPPTLGGVFFYFYGYKKYTPIILGV